MHRQLTLWIVALLLFCPVAEAATDQSKLDRLARDYWECYLADRPRTATFIGDDRYNAKLFDPSLAAYRRRFATARRFLQRTNTIDPAKLSPSDRVTHEILRRNLALALEGEALHTYLANNYLLPINHIEGDHIYLMVLPTEHPFRNTRDYRNYVARLEAFPGVADSLIEAMRAGIREGVVHPRVVVERVIEQLVDTSPLLAPLDRFPASIAAAQRTRLKAATTRAIQSKVNPAFARLHQFMRDEYLPKARNSFAIAELPKGAERYAYAIKVRSTTSLSADEVHEMALEELERAESARAELLKSIGFAGSTVEFNQQAQANRDLRFFDAGAVESEIRRNLAAIEPHLPRLFAGIPELRYEIRQVEPFRAASFPEGVYFPASADNSRPGTYYYNPHKVATEGVRKFLLPNLSFHEAVPGHGLQSAYGSASRDLPSFRRHGGNAAFNEGWAAYAEKLADEVGAYPDVYSRNFYLSASVFTWAGAVAETGMNSRGWSPEQASAFVRRYLPINQERFEYMIARHSVMPAQTLGYGIGALTISRLRSEAAQELGPKFDVREFHRFVLDGGAMQMDILTSEVRRWIAEQKSR